MSEGTIYDVAIIGGGLAGLSLAILSASKGWKVVLFEKETYPFHKVCGEYISLESRPFLERLGVPLSQIDVPLIKNLEVSDATGRVYNFKLPLGGFGISRHCLDNELHKIAVSKGVDVLTNTKVSDVSFVNETFVIKTSKGDYTSLTAAGCFGKRSNIDMKLNRNFIKQKPSKLNNYIGIKYHIKYIHPPDTIALHNFENGYCGISKIEEGRSCLCYLTTAANLEKHGNSIAEMERHLLFTNPLLKKIFTEAEFLFDKPLAISGVSFCRKKQVEDHILMVGDSSGMITPLCGNGMSMAMHAANIAFESLQLFLQKKTARNEMEETYKRNWQNQFSRRLQAGRIVQTLFGGKTTTAVFLEGMHSIPFIARQVIKATHGRAF